MAARRVSGSVATVTRTWDVVGSTEWQTARQSRIKGVAGPALQQLPCPDPFPDSVSCHDSDFECRVRFATSLFAPACRGRLDRVREPDRALQPGRGGCAAG